MASAQDFIGRTPGTARGKTRVRLVDLAEHLQLTKGTVSRALNGYSDISEATQTRVRKAADALGYRPLTHAQAIRTGRVRSVGLVLEIHEHDGHRPFVADFLAGLSQSAADEGWTLTVTTANTQAETLDRMRTLTEDQKADGFILPRTMLDDPRVRLLRDQGTPFVLYGRTADDTGCAWFDIESEAAFTGAVRRLAGLGHRRIGFVPGAPGYTYAKLRHEGFDAGLRAEGLTPDADLVAGPAVSQAEGAAQTRVLLDLPNPPTAIVYTVDHAALGAYGVAQDRGLRIGQDLSVISYDGIPEGALMQPPLSTYRVDSRAAGVRLASMLIRLCRGAAPEELRAMVRAEFLGRGSDGPAPGVVRNQSHSPKGEKTT